MSSREVTTRTGLKPATARPPGSSTFRTPGPSTSRAPGPSTSRAPGPSTSRAPSLSTSRTPANPVGKTPARTPARSRLLQKAVESSKYTPRLPKMARVNATPLGMRKTKTKPPEKEKESKQKEEPMRPSEALNTEYIYYNSCLKLVLPGLSDPEAQNLITPWLQKLNSPLYSTPSLKDKRNRFMHSLLITVLNDEAFGWFKQPPPRAALPEPSAMPVYNPPPCAWQADTSWQDILASVPTTMHRKGCVCGGQCPEMTNSITEQLDDEFRLILYLVRPYVALYTKPKDQEKITKWIQMLCCITTEACIMMKGIRNDYMTALYGYAHNLELLGPFEKLPDFERRLCPLHEVTMKHKPEFLDPTGTEAEDFLQDMPVPEEGAFCYIALTGDLLYTE